MTLETHVHALAGEIGERNLWRYSNLQRAAEYIEADLRSCGYAPARQTYEISRLPVSNIEAILPGNEGTASRADEILVVGAHYDTVDACPGANDNATGVAALLELARRFATRPTA